MWVNSIDQNGNVKTSFTDQLHSNSQGKGWQEVDIQITEKYGKIFISPIDFDYSQQVFFGLKSENSEVKWRKQEKDSNTQIPKVNWHNPNQNPNLQNQPTNLSQAKWHQKPNPNSESSFEISNLYFQRQITPDGKFKPDCGLHAVLHLTQNLSLTNFGHENNQTQLLIQNSRRFLGKTSADWMITPDLPKLFAYFTTQNDLKLKLFVTRSEIWKPRLGEFDGFIFNLNENHWVSVAKIQGRFYLFDSMALRPKEISLENLQQIYMESFGAFSLQK